MEMALIALAAFFTSVACVTFTASSPGSQPPPPPAPMSNCSDAYHLVPKVDRGYCLTGLNDGRVLMVKCSEEWCQYQLWKDDTSWGARFEDEVGNKAFAIVNVATGLALHHGYSSAELVDSKELLDIGDGFLWTTSEDFGDNFHAYRSCQNINLNLDVDHGDRKRGGVKDGSRLILFEWRKGDNQLWTKIERA